MKLTLIFLLLSIATTAFSKEKQIPICSIYYANSLIKKIENVSVSDKAKHCAVSCQLALRCSFEDVLEIGILKEVVDAFGPGDCDYEDLRADYEGAYMGSYVRNMSDETCFSQCKKRWNTPKPNNL